MKLERHEVQQLETGTKLLLTVPEAFKETDRYLDDESRFVPLIGSVVQNGDDPYIQLYSTAKRLGDSNRVFIYASPIFEGNGLCSSNSSGWNWDVELL